MIESYWGQGKTETPEPCPPKAVDLSGLVELSKANLSPAAEHFDRKVSMFFGQAREGRANNPEEIQVEQRLRRGWKREMDDLASFLATIENNPRSLILMPQMCKEKVDEEYGRKVKRLELIKNTDLKVTTGEKKQLSILVLNLITEKKGAPVISRNIGLDPAQSFQRKEEAGLIRIRIYTMKVSINAAGEQTRKRQLGIDVERVYRPELGYLLLVHYCFPNSRNVKVSETSIGENPLFNEVVNEAMRCFKRIFEQRYG